MGENSESRTVFKTNRNLILKKNIQE